MTIALPTDYTIAPMGKLSPEVFEAYWSTVVRHDLLKYRLCDVVDPDMGDVQSMLLFKYNLVFAVLESDKVVAEFTLNNFIGKSAQVHFSMHPDNSPQHCMYLARSVTDIVLNDWSTLDKPDDPYLLSLFGLTPVMNRRACAFVQRVGFKKMGILKGGQWYDGTICDALVTVKERTNGR